MTAEICSHNFLLHPSNYEYMFDGAAHMLDDAQLEKIVEEMVRPVAWEENQSLPAGYTYFGQFIAHDLSKFNDVATNKRTSKLDLDGVYGRTCLAELFEPNELGHKQFKIGRGLNREREEDLPRDPLSAKIPDRRNDLHFIISQLHLAFLKFHNRILEQIGKRNPHLSECAVFEETKKIVKFHYQWVVVHDFLDRICHPPLMNWLWPEGQLGPDPRETLSEKFQRFFRIPLTNVTHEPKLSYEFVLAGFRFGHSMVRPLNKNSSGPGYDLNHHTRRLAIFHPEHRAFSLEAERLLPTHWTVQWDRFLRMDESEPQFSRKISPHIAGSLAKLPKSILPAVNSNVTNLAKRTLQAGRQHKLVSGQTAGKFVKEIYTELGIKDFKTIDEKGNDPLWYYILKEADQLGGGQRLGPVGSWIVAFTITDVLRRDKTSFCNQNETWSPTLGKPGVPFTLADIIRHADMPVTKERWCEYVDMKCN
jgi:Animal haem peroxidase